MRRAAIILSLVITVLLPGSVAARASRCSIDVTPSVGSTTDVYRITVSNVPVDPAGGSIEVRADIQRDGTRDRSTFFAVLVPGATQFYFDYHVAYPGEPAPDPLLPGRYRVSAETSHLVGGCHAVAQFEVL